MRITIFIKSNNIVNICYENITDIKVDKSENDDSTYGSVGA